MTPLDPHRLSRLPWPVEVIEEVDSTNRVAGERSGECVVVAERQTAGRGRMGREWLAPPGSGLTFSLRLEREAAWGWIPLWAGYSLHAALIDRVDDLGLKWPNDLVAGDLKLAGILCERVGEAAIVGIGLNVLAAPIEGATCLDDHLEGTPDRTDVLGELLANLHMLRPLLAEPEALRRAYAGDCVTLGREVRVDLPGGSELTGTAVDIDAEGRLVVAGPEGEVPVAAGDVHHVRTA